MLLTISIHVLARRWECGWDRISSYILSCDVSNPHYKFYLPFFWCMKDIAVLMLWIKTLFATGPHYVCTQILQNPFTKDRAGSVAFAIDSVKLLGDCF